MVILQIGIIFAFLAIGELIVWLTGVPIPSSIIGMLLLAASLQLRLIRERHVNYACDFLVKNLGFFFVPAGVSVMLCTDIFREQWLPIVVATALSTLIVFLVTGQIHQIVRRFIRNSSSNHNHNATLS